MTFLAPDSVASLVAFFEVFLVNNSNHPLIPDDEAFSAASLVAFLAPDSVASLVAFTEPVSMNCIIFFATLLSEFFIIASAASLSIYLVKPYWSISFIPFWPNFLYTFLVIGFTTFPSTTFATDSLKDLFSIIFPSASVVSPRLRKFLTNSLISGINFAINNAIPDHNKGFDKKDDIRLLAPPNKLLNNLLRALSLTSPASPFLLSPLIIELIELPAVFFNNHDISFLSFFFCLVFGSYPAIVYVISSSSASSFISCVFKEWASFSVDSLKWTGCIFTAFIRFCVDVLSFNPFVCIASTILSIFDSIDRTFSAIPICIACVFCSTAVSTVFLTAFILPSESLSNVTSLSYIHETSFPAWSTVLYPSCLAISFFNRACSFSLASLAFLASYSCSCFLESSDCSKYPGNCPNFSWKYARLSLVLNLFDQYSPNVILLFLYLSLSSALYCFKVFLSSLFLSRTCISGGSSPYKPSKKSSPESLLNLYLK